MTTSQLIPVSFHGDSLFILNHQNEPFTPMKPIVECMGLTWGAQQQKLTANRKRWGISMIDIPTSSGEQSMLCMPVRKLPAYLGTITPSRVKPELRDKIILYQNECDDVLWRYWTGQQMRSDDSHPLTLTPSTVADRKPLNDLVQIWVDAAPITKRQAWEMIHAHFCIASIKDFTVEELEIVMDFVQARIDALPKSLPEAAHAEAPALKYPLHDFKQAEDVNRALVSKTMRLAMDWSQQLRKLADEAGDAFNHTDRRSNIMGLLDSTVYSHKQTIKRLSTAVGESVLAIAVQHEALMQLAQLMRRQEKI